MIVNSWIEVLVSGGTGWRNMVCVVNGVQGPSRTRDGRLEKKTEERRAVGFVKVPNTQWRKSFRRDYCTVRLKRKSVVEV